MTHRKGALVSVGLVAVMTAASAVVVSPAAAASSSPMATVFDGCGRVDSVAISTTGRFAVELLPDGKAPGKGASAIVPVYGSTWVRPYDTTKSYLGVRVLEEVGEGYEYVPMATAEGDVVRGTETMRLTNEDCVEPLAPTFTDEPGSGLDTVSIPQVTGVKYSGKPGTTAATGTVTVTATPDKGYRLATPDGVPIPPSETRWSHTFDATSDLSIPESATPVFKVGAVIPATAKTPAGRAPNAVVLRWVPGVSWIVDGTPVKMTDKQRILEVPVGTKTKVEVAAVPASPGSTVLVGTTEWVVEPRAAARPTVPRVGVPRSGVVAPARAGRSGGATVTWTPAESFSDRSRFNVRYRVITLTSNQVRARAPWRAWAQETSSRSGVFRALPGSVLEVQVQSVEGRRVSGWSAATPVHVPLDVTSANRFWTVERSAPAYGGTMLTSKQRNTAWTTRTPTTNQVLVWFGTSPTGGPAAVFVDGKRVATINTRSSKAVVRQVLRPIPVRWGQHTVTIVHSGRNGQTVSIDGIAYGR